MRLTKLAHLLRFFLRNKKLFNPFMTKPLSPQMIYTEFWRELFFRTLTEVWSDTWIQLGNSIKASETLLEVFKGTLMQI